MDIYKLSDFDGEKPRTKLKITELKQGLKNPERVNVFVDEKFAFSLDISQIVDLKIKVGREITLEELEDFKEASEFGKLYQRTLEWVLLRPRSKKECRDYLYKKVFEKNLDKTYIDSIIFRLEDKKYLNDENFAKYYVENRFVKKGASFKRLKMELMKKGISKDIIEKVLVDSDRSDKEELKKIISKKRSKYLDDQKLMQYLFGLADIKS